MRVLQRRAANRIELWERNRYLRVFATVDGLALVEVENQGTIACPDVRFAIRSGNLAAGEFQGIEQTLRKVLGLDVDPEPFHRLASAEPALGSTVSALHGLRPPRFAGLFETFANVVPFQQLSLEAGVAIVGNLVERFGKSLQYDGCRYHAFPTARSIADAHPVALRRCGLSARKAETLSHLGRMVESGELNEARIERMATKNALQTLLELRGIGPWSAALVLLRGFGRLDVFPPGDVGATRGLSALLHVEPGAPLDLAIERFGSLKGYLYFFSLGADLMKKDVIHATPRMLSRAT
ncbi:MAG: HhH-GPD domain protein [Burkholderiales bacterium]|nr:HhH-GPD domain protein [Burkholderiales bacterium]